MDTEDMNSLKYVDVVKTIDKTIVEKKYYNYNEVIEYCKCEKIENKPITRNKEIITDFIDHHIIDMMNFINEMKVECERFGMMNEYNNNNIYDLMKNTVDIEYYSDESSTEDEEDDFEDYYTS